MVISIMAVMLGEVVLGMHIILLVTIFNSLSHVIVPTTMAT